MYHEGCANRDNIIKHSLPAAAVPGNAARFDAGKQRKQHLQQCKHLRHGFKSLNAAGILSFSKHMQIDLMMAVSGATTQTI